MGGQTEAVTARERLFAQLSSKPVLGCQGDDTPKGEFAHPPYRPNLCENLRFVVRVGLGFGSNLDFF